MASKASGSRKLKKSILPKFEADVYSKIPSGELTVFAVHYLIEHKIEITLDDIVSACFLLFPHKFSLKKYPKWPDSAYVGRRWGISRKKGFITADSQLEYRLTTKGLRILKKVTKKLGLTQKPAQPKKEAVTPVEKVREEVKASTPKPFAAPHIKNAEPAQEDAAPTAPIKKKRVVQVKKAPPIAAPAKKAPTRHSAQKDKVTQLELIKVEPVPVIQVDAQARKKQAASVPKLKKTKPAEPILVPPVKTERVQSAPIAISKEVKERAGKFVRSMERSDAYIHYKRNGSKSVISEFDFRSLLLCTMESSAETLARNVELFKGYAGIHNRQDLIVFLNFCEDKFSYLLKPQNKLTRHAKK